MITENDVIKAIVECKKSDNTTNYIDVCRKLNIDDLTLFPFVNSLKEKGYIQSDLSQIYVTSLTMSLYENLSAKNKKLFYNFSKFTLKIFLEILIGIIVTVIASFIIYHFGWQ